MENNHKRLWKLAIFATYLLSVIVLGLLFLLIWIATSMLHLWFDGVTVTIIIFTALFVVFIIFLSIVIYELLDSCGVVRHIYYKLKFKNEQIKIEKQDTTNLKK